MEGAPTGQLLPAPRGRHTLVQFATQEQEQACSGRCRDRRRSEWASEEQWAGAHRTNGALCVLCVNLPTWPKMGTRPHHVKPTCRAGVGGTH